MDRLLIGIPSAPHTLLKGLVRRIKMGSSRHRGEELRRSPRIGLLDRVRIPTVLGRVMAHCRLAGDNGDSSRASLNRGRHSADTQKKHEGQLRQMKGMFPQSLIHRSAFRVAAEMSVHH